MKFLSKFRHVFILSCVTLAILFAAGNLTIPPLIGYEAKENTFISILGFISMGAGLPAIGIIAFSTVLGDFDLVTNKISKYFGNIYISVLFLITIFFSMPRTAIISNDMFLIPMLTEFFPNINFNIFITSFSFYLSYFLLVYIISMTPSKSIDVTAKLIMPILFFIISIIILGAIIHPQSNLKGPVNDYKNIPFIKGLIMGFLTIDALTTHMIAKTLIDKINEKEIKPHSVIIKDIFYSSIITLIILCLIYYGLAYIGSTTFVEESLTNGGPILIKSAYNSFGVIGKVLLSISVLIACFTTAFTVLISAAKHFNSIMPFISYKTFLIIECIICTFISNLNFNVVIKLVSPILDIMYPIIIIIIIFILLKKYLNHQTLKSALISANIVNIFYILHKYTPINLNILKILPLFDEGIGWFFPTLIVTIIFHIITFKKYDTIKIDIEKNMTYK